MFVLRDRSSGRYLAPGLVLLTDAGAAIGFDCAEAAAWFAGRGWCAEVELAVEERPQCRVTRSPVAIVPALVGMP
jgi:hypothetical protein